MKLQLNGAPVEVQATTLFELLQAEGLSEAKVATAVNGTFVPAMDRADHKLREGDNVEVLAPMQGG